MNLTGADVQVLWTLLERLLARRHRQRPSHIQTVEVDPSTISVIVAADLPSEVGIIVETATHLVQLPMRDPTVATTHLAYATPEPHPIEATLRSIAATSDGRLTLPRTTGRATKRTRSTQLSDSFTHHFVILQIVIPVALASSTPPRMPQSHKAPTLILPTAPLQAIWRPQNLRTTITSVIESQR